MPDHCCCSAAHHPPAPQPAALTRRRLLVGGAVAGGILALKGLPGAAQEGPTPLGPTTTTPGPTAPGPGTTPAPTTAPEHPDSRDFGFDPPSSASPDRHIMFPVLGKVSWSDTYLAPRGSGRKHEGQDLMGAKMLKLLACVDGTVIELRHQSGGNSLYLQDAQGWYYSYLHINNDTPGTDDGKNPIQFAFAPGLKQGDRVKKGQHLAYVGDSGNAEDAGSHCHFEIRQPHSGGLWRSSSVNPKVSLQNATPAKEGPAVPPEVFQPYRNSTDFVKRQYLDLLGRAASASDIAYWGGLLDSGSWSPEQQMQHFLESAEADSKGHAVGRLYLAFFRRLPDLSGFTYWIGERRRGVSISRIATLMSQSPEFARTYGPLDDAAFVDRVYRNVLERPADPDGLAFWTSELERGVSRGKVMVQFSDSAENRNRQRLPMHVVVAYGCMLRRMATPEELVTWVAHINDGGSTRDMVNMMRMGPEYKSTL